VTYLRPVSPLGCWIYRHLGWCGTRLSRTRLLMTTYAFAILLDWRTRHRTVRTKNTAVARKRLDPFAAAFAVVKELAGVGRHRLGSLMIALRTGERRFQLHSGLLAISLAGGRSSVSQFAATTKQRCGGKNNRSASRTVDADFVLIVAWALACLRKRGPYR